MERRRLESAKDICYVLQCSKPIHRLHRFLQRLARHPTLQRSTLVRAFFESTEWVTRPLKKSSNVLS